jgi:hypothetical protein
VAVVYEYAEIGATPDEVWKVVGDFAGMFNALRLPVQIEMEGEGVGALRTARVGDITAVERLEETDETNWRISYSLLDRGRLPLTDYYSTIQLAPAGAERCTLTWTSRFEPADVTEADASATVHSIHEPIISALRHRFGA